MSLVSCLWIIIDNYGFQDDQEGGACRIGPKYLFLCIHFLGDYDVNFVTSHYFCYYE